MKTLEQLKEEYAKRAGYKAWVDLLKDDNLELSEIYEHYDQVAVELAMVHADQKLEDTGKKTFITDPKELIKTFEDALEFKGETSDSFWARTKGLSKDTVAYEQLKVISWALNGGKHMDYKNTKIGKYYPWFTSSGSGFSYDGCGYDESYSFIGARLCVLIPDLAKYFGTQFLSIWDKYING